jgi:xanthine dehydrogenase YagR molybdenum-binding subunit
MEMNSPVGPNTLDTQGIVGRPLDRVDGRLKVTGGARYAYEMQQDGVLYGFVVEASIAKGTIRSIDTRAAEKAPGVATRRPRAPAITAKRTRCSPARK